MDNYFNIKIITKEKKNVDYSKDSLIVRNEIEVIKLDKFIINKLIANKLCNLSTNPMNLFIFGRKGVGKYTLCRFYINKILNYESNLQELTFTNDNKELIYYYSKNHYEIIINKYNFNDIHLFINFFKKMCGENTTYSKIKNIIVLRNFHIIKQNNIKYLRNIIEKYSINNIFIFISHDTIPNVLKGFLTLIRVPKPNFKEMKILCNKICKQENYSIKKDEIEYIINLSDGSLSKMINIIELSFINDKYEKYEDIDVSKYKFIIKILKKKNLETLYIMRDLINELIIDNIDYYVLLNNILKLFILENKKNKISDEKIIKIIEVITNCDKNISLGLREIHHIEYLFVQLMNIL